MYRSSRHENTTSLNFNIPWDSNTARGFAIALAMTALMVLIAPVMQIDPPSAREIELNTIPLEILNFGDGDGTGMSKGNLAEEGEIHKGREPQSNLNDAEIAAKTKLDRNATPQDPDAQSNFVARNELSSDQASSDQARGSNSRDVGSPDGSPGGTGLGEKGN
ncbi:MAG: hypothetical protein ACLFQX_08175, partial [Candidatus Kapaibacterium sp.]